MTNKQLKNLKDETHEDYQGRRKDNGAFYRNEC